ncbi:hypothetical protein GPA10_11165 [Streptomyces sp. p1417]|uniref:Lipoprotein n=1 Tax=Streptomyces typhae TaxID=2681492 RepID=A0A6L6WUD6_9ACTN|nr:hypothetical protein [Streptomyces typhae]MVO85297.1 hypothetical protein [Streptomyces typhae]
MDPIGRTGAAAVATVCLAVTLVGCGAVRDEPDRAPPPAVGRPGGGVRSVSPAQQAALSQAQHRSTAACMAAQGFRYRVPPALPAAAGPDNPYGLLGEESARVSGYGLSGHRDRGGPPQDQSASVPPPQRAQWQRALFGTRAHRVVVPLPGGGEVFFNTDGCVQRARTEVYGERWDRLQYTFQGLSHQVVAAVERAGPVRAAHREWASCMERSGLPAATPKRSRALVVSKLEQVAAGRLSPREAVRFELRTATEDARCQRQSALAPAVAAAAREEERRVLRTRAGEFRLLRDLRAAALGRVED